MGKKNKTKKKNESNYRSGSVLLEASRLEYQNDIGTIDSLYTRVGITIAFVVIVLGYQFENAKMIYSLDITQYTDFLYHIKVLSLALFSLSVLINAINVIVFLSVIAVGKIERISTEGFISESCKIDIDEHAWYIASIYVDCIKINDKRIKKKLQRYNSGILLTMVSIILMTIYMIISLI